MKCLFTCFVLKQICFLFLTCHIFWWTSVLLKKIRVCLVLTYNLTRRGFSLHFLEHSKLNYAESRMGNTWFPVSVVRKTQTGGSKMSLHLISQASVNIRLQKHFVNLSISIALTVIFTRVSLEQWQTFVIVTHVFCFTAFMLIIKTCMKSYFL